MIHYLLGYGSLITKESRYNTSITGKCLPVKLNNYKRYWNARINKNNKKYTAVSIEYSPDSKINAAITVINKDDLPFYDKREQNYERILKLKILILEIMKQIKLFQIKRLYGLIK